MRILQGALFISVLYIFFSTIAVKVHAGEYVLPYPPLMPGSKFYGVTRLLDILEQWWYWGSVAAFKYHLKLADKYIVEAKTLFEYKQYQLGVEALRRSDTQIPHIGESLRSAQREDKDIQKLKTMAKEAMQAHKFVLEKLLSELPETFGWRPEKQTTIILEISQILDESIEKRKKLTE